MNLLNALRETTPGLPLRGLMCCGWQNDRPPENVHAPVCGSCEFVVCVIGQGGLWAADRTSLGDFKIKKSSWITWRGTIITKSFSSRRGRSGPERWQLE